MMISVIEISRRAMGKILRIMYLELELELRIMHQDGNINCHQRKNFLFWMKTLAYLLMTSGHHINTSIDISVHLIQWQRTALLINTTSQEIEWFIGLQIYISIYQMHWTTRYSLTADIMSRNWYQKLHEFLHVENISQKDDLVNAGNKLCKMQPVLDASQF